MTSVDTNVLLRWLAGDVPEQTSRVNELFASGGRFIVDDATVIETVYVLERVMAISRAKIAEAIRILAAEACLVFDREHWIVVAEHYVGHPKLSVNDIHCAVRAHERGDTLFTFDRKLANQLDSVELL